MWPAIQQLLNNLTYHDFHAALNIACNHVTSIGALCNCVGRASDEECNNHQAVSYRQGRQSHIAHWLLEHPDPVKLLLSCGYELYQVGNLLAKAEGLIKNYGFIYEPHSFPAYRGPLC